MNRWPQLSLTRRVDPTASVTSITAGGVTTRMNQSAHEATADLGRSLSTMR
jgi:hypothetical protein